MKKNLLYAKKVSFFFSPQLKVLFNCLTTNGDNLRIVGGSVRDFISNNKIADIDLACKFPPEKTLSILESNNVKVVLSGIKYGTLTAIINGQSFQITTLRKDVENFGRSAKVEFVNDFYEDAKRRDFTINAMSIDFAGNLYDYFGGVTDLEGGIVRFIGDSQSRIKEDYLRILRFFRFSCKYAKSLDDEGLNACVKYKNNLENLSIERIKDEFFKILSCKNRNNLMMILKVLRKNEILSFVKGFSWENLDYLQNLFEIEKILNQNFSPLIILIILSPKIDLRLSNAEEKYLQQLIKIQNEANFKCSKKDLLKLMLKFDKSLIKDAFIVKLALNSDFKNFVDDFLKISKILEISKIPDFPINGQDLIYLNAPPKEIGKLLNIAQEYWLENNFTPNNQQIRDFLQKKLKNNDY
jgi:poly(A) polymerase